MNADRIISVLGEDWGRMKALLRSSLHTDVGLLEETNSGILSHSGKMLRPLISLLTAKALGTPNGDSLRYAAASELLHNATLMHDDVADESAERRGYPTVSAVLGPSAAVLVGDFWLAKAVEMVLGSEHYEKVVRFFSKTLTDLAEGEMYQLEKASSADTQEEDYFRIIRCKTASLFEAAGVSAAYSVNAPDHLVRAAEEYATAFGVAFQIKDDILDYAGTEGLGKPVGVDLRERKITLPLLGALSTLDDESSIRGKIRDISLHPEYCREIHSFVLERGGIEYAASRLEEYIERAVGALNPIPDSPSKEALVEIAHFNAFRQI